MCCKNVADYNFMFTRNVRAIANTAGNVCPALRRNTLLGNIYFVEKLMYNKDSVSLHGLTGHFLSHDSTIAGI